MLIRQPGDAQSLRTPAIAQSLQHLHDRRQCGNAFVGSLSARFSHLHPCIGSLDPLGREAHVSRRLILQKGGLFGERHDNHLQRINVVRKLFGSHRHDWHHSMFAAVFPTLSMA
ncbi:hypothetical protein [Mesorhizobium sp. STM 4661]|uniref:hypothetical protein n=1 Tax=Mesorhizobium sp. STM 4661 TaxID=1297570 RepID=UPI0003A9C96E|nr:hypothetical protein [Mesorhizobium sp. STM 4661]